MKAALVLGASGDIGKAICKRLASEGWSLYLHGFTHIQEVRAEAAHLSKLYPTQDFFPMLFDLKQEENMDAFAANLFSLDAIVFAQGYTKRSLFTEMTSHEMDAMWNVHVKVPLLLIQKTQKKLSRSGHGRIIFISSVYGFSGSALEVFYSMTKGAQNSFVKAYSKEVARQGITINAIAPGAIETPMNGFLDTDETNELMDAIPAGRLGVPSDIAFWVSHLLKKESGYMTGQTLTVSGGWLD